MLWVYKNKTIPVLHINLLIKYSVQQQIYFNVTVFGNKCCRCNEGSLYNRDTVQLWCSRLNICNNAALIWTATSENVISHVHPLKVLIRLRVRAVWSESFLGAFWIAKDAKFLHAYNENSVQTTWMRRLIWVFVRRICQKVRFSLIAAHMVGRFPQSLLMVVINLQYLTR